MHTIEPHYHWMELYSASEDPRSPLFEAENSIDSFTNTIYGYYIHPQWDSMESDTLFLKILFVDYEQGVGVIEFIGEWNDAIENDIMQLKRGIIDPMVHEGIRKFILVGENVFNFHGSDDSYYEEWFEDVEDGWIAGVNFQDHVIREMHQFNLDSYINFGGKLDELPWRTYPPKQLVTVVDGLLQRRLN
ncbi:hypothetical protein F0P96_15095 [Hymenobacter busanensis]|uniref:Uncharacterized protein n=1 Tax=Hymenobacter busanensis TaxID=2607656 RepID=A0A7L5A151_9BACT|nr:hypothetical protein [Hymenobacter busanensis]KAA9331561.1 hypothetical protein F0P96_15095 [Hymenobacter busanensis]QHJ08715.1 hypothetical protein GUY19_16030 [Hymenobacter busanensis]